MNSRLLLLSIQPKYAEKIFDGTKLVELRRTRPDVVSGDLGIVYVSSPISAIVGIIEIDRIIEASPIRLWSEVRDHAGISKQSFDDYYRGAERAFGLVLKGARSFPRPVDLCYLRRIWEGFRPPQSFRYLSIEDFGVIESASNLIRKRELLSMMP
jgi:predicted transcriptional regulator